MPEQVFSGHSAARPAKPKIVLKMKKRVLIQCTLNDVAPDNKKAPKNGDDDELHG